MRLPIQSEFPPHHLLMIDVFNRYFHPEAARGWYLKALAQ